MQDITTANQSIENYLKVFNQHDVVVRQAQGIEEQVIGFLLKKPFYSRGDGTDGRNKVDQVKCTQWSPFNGLYPLFENVKKNQQK